MTSQPQPAPGEGKTAGQYLRPLRDLAAYALVGAAAVLLFVAIVDLIPGGDDQFGYRTQSSFGEFINLATITFPIAAVLLSLLVAPRHPRAQLVVLVAVIEYAVMAVFGVLFGVLIGLINEAGNNGARSAFEGLLVRIAWLAVFAVAAYAVYQIWRGMFYAPKPKPQPQPGVYGQPAYGQPGTYPGQPGYGPQPGPPHPGAGYPGQPGQPGFPPPQGGFPPPPQQQGYGQGVYGQPPAPAWNQPPVAMPAPGQPDPAAPQSAPPAAHPEPTQVVPQSEPTQVVPQHPGPPPADRTQKMDERPGFGPADQDPPRQ